MGWAEVVGEPEGGGSFRLQVYLTRFFSEFLSPLSDVWVLGLWLDQCSVQQGWYLGHLVVHQNTSPLLSKNTAIKKTAPF